MDDIAARLLAADEDDLWFAAGPEGSVDDEGAKAARKRLAARADHDARCFLIAVRGTDVIARLQGAFLGRSLYAVSELVARQERDFPAAASALVRFLSRSFLDDGTEIISVERPKYEPINAALSRSGFVMTRSKVFVKRALVGYRSPHADPFSHKSLAEVGEDEFIRVLTDAAEGDPFEDMTTIDPKTAFDELVDYAGSKFDPTWWTIAYLGKRPVGVVLPQLYPKQESEGTLFYVGVLPEFRRRGFGAILHAAGLAFLAEHGATAYIGSTDSRSAAMIRVFNANGCPQTATQLFYTPIA